VDLRQWRTLRRYTQAKASRYLKVSESMMARMEAGRRLPGLELAHHIEKRAKIPTHRWLEHFNIEEEAKKETAE